ncbi:hypothetical protein KSP40_PGU012742 [Platanthera guangdongensis]|uniref:Isopenicillin N synthase-like Fe(2+) 2OG dioxygenase domain-containing protein n=1 Tax=Platanthera guangdongensis TaxID=2320717 RepID=A0ABR2MN45_9ASPA
MWRPPSHTLHLVGVPPAVASMRVLPSYAYRAMVGQTSPVRVALGRVEPGCTTLNCTHDIPAVRHPAARHPGCVALICACGTPVVRYLSLLHLAQLTHEAVFGEDELAYQIGEITEILSQGLLCATPHCVQAPKGEETIGVERSALALFMQPDWDEFLKFPSEVHHHQELIPPNGRLTFGEYSEALLHKYYQQNYDRFLMHPRNHFDIRVLE